MRMIELDVIHTLLQVLGTQYKRQINVLGTCSIRDCPQTLRVIASDHVLSTTLARVIEFDPRLNCIRTTCNTRGYTRTKFWSAQNFFPRPHRR